MYYNQNVKLKLNLKYRYNNFNTLILSFDKKLSKFFKFLLQYLIVFI